MAWWQDFLATIAALDADLDKAGPELASIRTNLAEALNVLADTTDWLM